MAFRGWLRFAGDEIANSQRLKAYVAAGLVPSGTELKGCDDCDTLNILNDEDPYRSPLLDQAPWYDVNDQSTWEFAGLQILDISGLEGSTRTATFTELAAGGAVSARPRNASRVVAVSALLMGATPESMTAGMEWLSSVLKGGGCLGGCGGDELCIVTACPELCDESTDPDSPLIDFPISPTDPGWLPIGGTYASGIHRFLPSGAEGILAAPVQGPYDDFTAHWSVTSTGGPFTVWLGAVDVDGNELDRGDPIPVGFTLDVDYHTTSMFEGDWRPAIWVSTPGALVTLEVTHREYRTVDDCSRPFIRNYRDVVTISGPTVTDRIGGDDCSGVEFLKVTWTWQVGSPYIYQVDQPLVTGMPSNMNSPVSVALGVETAVPGPGTFNPCISFGEVPKTSLCQDPCCVAYIPPPALPVVADPCRPTTQFQYTRSTAQIPPRYVPVNVDGTLRIELLNDSRPKVGVRVRVYMDPIGNGLAGVSECDFCSEWNVTYMPGNGRLVIDGSMMENTAYCAGSDTGETATTVRGPHYKPVSDWPILTCGVGYVVVVDVPQIYQDDCPPYYSFGGVQGNLSWSVDMIPRGE